jgi:hypothetical protein
MQVFCGFKIVAGTFQVSYFSPLDVMKLLGFTCLIISRCISKDPVQPFVYPGSSRGGQTKAGNVFRIMV